MRCGIKPCKKKLFSISGVAGRKQLAAVYFTIPRGTLVNDGSSVRLVNATYYWAPVSTKCHISIIYIFGKFTVN
jgi:hypothetical protein